MAALPPLVADPELARYLRALQKKVELLEGGQKAVRNRSDVVEAVVEAVGSTATEATQAADEVREEIVVDRREPARPENLEAVVASYWDAQGQPRVAVHLAWDPVAIATDGTELAVAQYQLWTTQHAPGTPPEDIETEPEPLPEPEPDPEAPEDPEPVDPEPEEPDPEEPDESEPEWQWGDGEAPDPVDVPEPEPEPDPEPEIDDPIEESEEEDPDDPTFGEPDPEDPEPEPDPIVILSDLSAGLSTSTAEAVLDGLLPGVVVEVAVRARTGTGVWGQLSRRVIVVADFDAPLPPAPSPALLTTAYGTVTATWDGTTADSEPAPKWVAGALVLKSDTLDGEYTTTGVLIGGPALSGVLTEGLEIGTPTFVRLVLVDAAGRLGPASTASTITVDGVSAEIPEDVLESIVHAQETADGKNAVHASATAPTGDHAAGDLWYQLDGTGRVIGVRIWNGTEWTTYAIVADSIIVPGSVGATLINDGAITTAKLAAEAVEANNLKAGAVTAEKLTATAIDGKTITGALVQSESALNRGVKVDSSGVRAYNSSGALKFSVDATTGQLTAVDGSFTGSINATSGEIAGDLTITGLLKGTGMMPLGAYEFPSTLTVGPGYIHQRWLGDEDNIDGRFVTLGMGVLNFGSPTRAFDPNDVKTITDDAWATYYDGGIDYNSANGDGDPNSFAKIAANGRLLLQPKNGVRINPGDYDATPPATLTSADHPFQIGPSVGAPVLVADNSRIQVRYLGAGVPLALNPLGGNVALGDSSSTVNVTGRVNATHLPWAMAAGTVTITPTAANTNTSVTITFPAGRFSVMPRITLGNGSASSTTGLDYQYWYSGASATGMTLTVRRGNTTSCVLNWTAAQMTSGAASG